MDKKIWDQIFQFDLDSPSSEYGFSNRLAKENFWTKEFTNQAISEYKKFMYLAATSDFMVAPSGIVDTVWHQHLIFTESYHNFCVLLGKQIKHIPSTHNKEDFQKFKQAKERTIRLYENNFGKQPPAIWCYDDMYGSLNLRKATINLRTFLMIGILLFFAFTIPCYFLLKSFYITIDNPNFIFSLIGLTSATFIGLEYYNRSKFRQIIRGFESDSFIFNLQPYELVYLKTQKLSNVITGVVNELISDKTVKVNSNNTIELVAGGIPKSNEQRQTATVLKELGKTFYPRLLNSLAAKPIFLNTQNCMDAFKKFFYKSEKLGKLFYFNFCILSVLLMLAFIRLGTGILRDKPFIQIAIAVIVLTVAIVFYLSRLSKLMCTKAIPNFYKNEILPNRQVKNNWQWSYFLLGTAVISSSFVPLVRYVTKNDQSVGGSGTACASSCGSSCGSSCSSCGGCGGD